MQTYKIESKVNEIRMHTVTINGAPCIVVVYPDGTVEINAQTVKVSEPKVKATPQPKPRKQTARKEPVPKAKFLNPIIDASRFYREFPVPSWAR